MTREEKLKIKEAALNVYNEIRFSNAREVRPSEYQEGFEDGADKTLMAVLRALGE